MTKHSIPFYMAYFLGIAAIGLLLLYGILYIFPSFRYLLPPVVLSIGYFKPFNWNISFKNVLASLVFLLISYFFIFLTKDDDYHAVVFIPCICLFYLEYIKKSSSDRTLSL